MLDRQLNLHVMQDGRIVAVVTCPTLDLAISRYVYNRFELNGWKYPLQLVDRVMREWHDLDYAVTVTFEA